jgi:hypothetical protein
MENTPEEYAMVTLSMEELNELHRILRGHCRNLSRKEARGDEVPEDKVELANAMLHRVSDLLLEIETYDIIGDAMRDGSFEKVVKSWQGDTGDHG